MVMMMTFVGLKLAQRETSYFNSLTKNNEQMLNFSLKSTFSCTCMCMLIKFCLLYVHNYKSVKTLKLHFQGHFFTSSWRAHCATFLMATLIRSALVVWKWMKIERKPAYLIAHIFTSAWVTHVYDAYLILNEKHTKEEQEKKEYLFPIGSK